MAEKPSGYSVGGAAAAEKGHAAVKFLEAEVTAGKAARERKCGIAADGTQGALEEIMRILLAIDESKFSEAATQVLAGQFRPQDTEVRVLHVREPIAISVPPQMSPGYAPEMRELIGDQMRRGEELVARAIQTLRTAGMKVSPAIEVGDPKTRIIDHAAEWHADMIVLGSHGRNAVMRFLLGSVSEAVARHAPCSVVIVRMPPHQ